MQSIWKFVYPQTVIEATIFLKTKCVIILGAMPYLQPGVNFEFISFAQPSIAFMSMWMTGFGSFVTQRSCSYLPPRYALPLICCNQDGDKFIFRFVHKAKLSINYSTAAHCVQSIRSLAVSLLPAARFEPASGSSSRMRKAVVFYASCLLRPI